MGKNHIEPILSLTSLLESLHHYGRPSEANRNFVLSPQNKFNSSFIKDIVPLEEEDEDRAITALIYREETLMNVT